MYQKKDDVDVYRIRTYKIPLGSSGKDSAADVEAVQHRLGTTRAQAHYDPVGGFRGLEWTFEANDGELFMFYQQYGVWYVSNVSGGVALNQFRDWILTSLTQLPTEKPADAVCAPQQDVQALMYAAPNVRIHEEDEEGSYENYALEYVKSLY